MLSDGMRNLLGSVSPTAGVMGHMADEVRQGAASYQDFHEAIFYAPAHQCVMRVSVGQQVSIEIVQRGVAEPPEGAILVR